MIDKIELILVGAITVVLLVCSIFAIRNKNND